MYILKKAEKNDESRKVIFLMMDKKMKEVKKCNFVLFSSFTSTKEYNCTGRLRLHFAQL